MAILSFLFYLSGGVPFMNRNFSSICKKRQDKLDSPFIKMNWFPSGR